MLFPMARGWGKSEEDLEAEREQAREEKTRVSRFASAEEARRSAGRRTIELSLARIDQELSGNPPETRRRALEAAREELRARLGAESTPPGA
jgi:hypothetical protein